MSVLACIFDMFISTKKKKTNVEDEFFTWWHSMKL
jgi:hypothetical protein